MGTASALPSFLVDACPLAQLFFLRIGLEPAVVEEYSSLLTAGAASWNEGILPWACDVSKKITPSARVDCRMMRAAR